MSVEAAKAAVEEAEAFKLEAEEKNEAAQAELRVRETNKEQVTRVRVNNHPEEQRASHEYVVKMYRNWLQWLIRNSGGCKCCSLGAS